MQDRKGKPSRKRRPNDWKVHEEVELPEFLPQQCHLLWHLWFWSPWVSSKCGPDKATCTCPILPLYPQKNNSHKGERGRSGAVWQSSAPQRLEEVIGFAYEDHGAEIQPSTASKFHKFLFSLKNSLISWEDSLACNVERKVILPAEAWFVYNVLERLLFVFSTAEKGSGCCRQQPCRTGERSSAPMLDANSKTSKYCIGWAFCKRLFLETTYLCAFNVLADPS